MDGPVSNHQKKVRPSLLTEQQESTVSRVGKLMFNTSKKKGQTKDFIIHSVLLTDHLTKRL